MISHVYSDEIDCTGILFAMHHFKIYVKWKKATICVIILHEINQSIADMLTKLILDSILQLSLTCLHDSRLALSHSGDVRRNQMDGIW